MKGQINLKSKYCPEAGRNYLELFIPQGMTGAQVERFAAGKRADLDKAQNEQVNLFYDADGVIIEKADRLPLKVFRTKNVIGHE